MRLDQDHDDIKNGISINIRNDDNNIDHKLYLLLFGVWNKLSLKLIKIDNCTFTRHRKIDYYQSFVKMQQIRSYKGTDNMENYSLRNEKFTIDSIDDNKSDKSDEKENEARPSSTYKDNATTFVSSRETYQYLPLSDYIQINDTETNNSDIDGYNDKMKVIDMFDAFHHGIQGIKKNNSGDQNSLQCVFDADKGNSRFYSSTIANLSDEQASNHVKRIVVMDTLVRSGLLGSFNYKYSFVD